MCASLSFFWFTELGGVLRFSRSARGWLDVAASFKFIWRQLVPLLFACGSLTLASQLVLPHERHPPRHVRLCVHGHPGYVVVGASALLSLLPLFLFLLRLDGDSNSAGRRVVLAGVSYFAPRCVVALAPAGPIGRRARSYLYRGRARDFFGARFLFTACS